MLTPNDRQEIVCLLEMCGVSRFNSVVLPNGVVTFWSAGLTADEIEDARTVVVMALRKAKKEGK